jgi:hypothetical protein
LRARAICRCLRHKKVERWFASARFDLLVSRGRARDSKRRILVRQSFLIHSLIKPKARLDIVVRNVNAMFGARAAVTSLNGPALPSDRRPLHSWEVQIFSVSIDRHGRQKLAVHTNGVPPIGQGRLYCTNRTKALDNGPIHPFENLHLLLRIGRSKDPRCAAREDSQLRGGIVSSRNLARGSHPPSASFDSRVRLVVVGIRGLIELQAAAAASATFLFLPYTGCLPNNQQAAVQSKTMTTRMITRLPLLLVALLLPHVVVQAQYLPNGEVGWKTTLAGRMRRGNGIQITRDGVIVATTDNGMLHFITNVTPEPTVTVYSPTADMADNAVLLCRSKPVLASGMAIYAVSNTILAVNVTDQTTIYATILPNGNVVGTPAVSRRGLSIYVTHNDEVSNTGSISVLQLLTGRLLATLPNPIAGAPFGPPAVVHRQDTADDIVVFGDATDNGFSTSTTTTFANLYALGWNLNAHRNRQGLGEQSYRLFIAATNVPSVYAAVEFTNDLRVFIGGAGSLVVAFDNGAQYNLFDGNDRTLGMPSWTATLDFDSTNPLTRTYILPCIGYFCLLTRSLFLLSCPRRYYQCTTYYMQPFPPHPSPRRTICSWPPPAII